MYLKMSTCQNFIVITSLLTVTLLFKVISESDSLEKFAEKKWWYSVELRSGGIGSMQWCIVPLWHTVPLQVLIVPKTKGNERGRT